MIYANWPRITIAPPFPIISPPIRLGPSGLMLITLKITTFIKKMWKALFFWKTKNPLSLSRNQVRLIKDAKDFRKKKVERHTRKISEVQQELPPAEMKRPCLPEDPELLRLTGLMQGFTQVLVQDSIFPILIQPALPGLQKSITGSFKSLHQWNEVFRNVCESASPILQRLQRLGDPAITLVIQQLLHLCFTTLDDQGGQKGTLEKLLKEKIEALKDDNEINEHQFKEAYEWVEPLLNWIYHSNNWFLNSDHPTHLHHFIFDAFHFLNAFSILLNKGELEDYIDRFLQFISEDFEAVIKNALEINTVPIATHLMSRVSELITHLPYTETYDDLMEAVCEHLEAWIAANQACEEHKKLIRESEKTVKGKGSNASEINLIRDAKALLKLVEEDGGEEAFLEKEFLRSFGKSTGCNPKMQEVIKCATQHLPEMGEELQKKIVHDLVEKIFAHFLPNQKIGMPQDLLVDINGMLLLFDQISLPKELEQMKAATSVLFEYVLEKSDVKDKSNFKQYFFFFGKVVAIEIIHGKVKRQVAKGLSEALDKLSNKSEIDQIASEKFLPSLLLKSFQGFVRSEITRHVDLVTPFAMRMIDEPENYRNHRRALINCLFVHMQGLAIDFKMAEEGITYEIFSELADPLILEMENLLRKRLEERGTLTSTASLEDLKKYYEWPKVPVNSNYGRMIRDSITISNSGGWLLKSSISLIESTLSELTSQTCHHFRENYKHLVRFIAESESQRLLDSEKIKELFFSEEPSIEKKHQIAEQIKIDLPKRIRSIAALSHDSLYSVLKSHWTPFVQHATPSTATFETLIKDIYNRIMHRPLVNKSLFVRCLDIFNRSLQKSAEQLDESK